ncbi:non capsid protein NS 1 [Echinococcus multilocularis]|uniref:Non capsid protein NS 1 n=1 Tax=Echinococcus multilocularis TaxID=6211 RepID=A0A087VWJ3_ECHMU|nr:non capsid protein NS 1 [Echinococcus multilocularis]
MQLRNRLLNVEILLVNSQVALASAMYWCSVCAVHSRCVSHANVSHNL